MTVHPQTPWIIRGIVAAGIALSCLSSDINAAHYDVVPYASGTGAGAKILTGGYDDLGSLPTEQLMRVYGYDFGENVANFAGGPGFNNGSAFTSGIFPSDGKLPAGAFAMETFSGGYGPLHYWDGSGAPAFSPVAGGIEINVSWLGSNLRVGASSGPGTLFIKTILAAGPDAGRVHEHLTSSIGSGGSGSSFTTLGAPDGLYAFGATLSGGGLVSDPVYFVFNQGMTEEVHDEGIAFYSSQVVPEPSSFALAGLGAIGLAGLAMRRRIRRWARETSRARVGM